MKIIDIPNVFIGLGIPTDRLLRIIAQPVIPIFRCFRLAPPKAAQFLMSASQ